MDKLDTLVLERIKNYMVSCRSRWTWCHDRKEYLTETYGWSDENQSFLVAKGSDILVLEGMSDKLTAPKLSRLTENLQFPLAMMHPYNETYIYVLWNCSIVGYEVGFIINRKYIKPV